MSAWPPPTPLATNKVGSQIHADEAQHAAHHNAMADVVNTVVERVLEVEAGMVLPPPAPTNPSPGTPFSFLGADDAAWDPEIWTVTATTTGSALIVGNEGVQRIAAAANAEVRSRIADLNIIDSTKVWKSFDVVLDVYVNGIYSGASSAPIIRFKADGAGNRYELKFVPHDGSWLVQKVTGNGVTFTTVASGSGTAWVADVKRRVRVRVTGAQLQIRWWATGSTEPNTWQVDLIMDAGLDNRGFELVTFGGASAASFSQAQREVVWDEIIPTHIEEPTAEAPNPVAGRFATVGSDIADPAGYRFHAIGWNVTSGFRTSVGGGYTTHWVNDTNNYAHMTAPRVAYMKSVGMTCVRMPISLWGQIPNALSGSDNSADRVMDGWITACDLLIANGIAVQGPSGHKWTGASPTWATVSSDTSIMYCWQRAIERYRPGGTYQGVNRYEANAAGFSHAAGGSPYLFLDLLNEPWGSGNYPGWLSLHNAAYSYAYNTHSWRGIFIAEAPQWGQQIDEILTTNSVFEQFKSGKQDVVIGWHSYGDKPNIDNILTAFKTKGIPVLVGEVGTHWNETFQGDQADGIQAAAARAGRDKIYANAFGSSTKANPGMVAWISSWNGYNLTPRINARADLAETATALSRIGQMVETLAGQKPAPQLISGGSNNEPPPDTPPSGTAPTYRAAGAGTLASGSYVASTTQAWPSVAAGTVTLIVAGDFSNTTERDDATFDMLPAGKFTKRSEKAIGTLRKVEVWVGSTDGTETGNVTIRTKRISTDALNYHYTQICSVMLTTNDGDAGATIVTVDPAAGVSDTSLEVPAGTDPGSTNPLVLRGLMFTGGTGQTVTQAGITSRARHNVGTSHSVAVYTDDDGSMEAITPSITSATSQKVGFTIVIPRGQ